MELMERVSRFKRNLDFADDPNVPWYRRKRNCFLLVGLAVVVCLVVVFCATLFAYKAPEDSPEAEPRVLPPLEWDGVCPKKAAVCPASFQGIPPVLLVSLDGFRADLMDRGFTPTIKNIAQCGTHAPYMFPVFPSKTFPNHYSQVTGLNPSSHGIVDNSFYDPVQKKLFKVGQPESHNSYWWLREPVWVTAEKQGKKTACYYWPGSESKINGTRPSYYKKYNPRVSFEARVDQVLSWLDYPADSRPHFIALYVNQPDWALHHFGTNAKETNDALMKVDLMINRLFSGLQQRNLVNCVNVIIMSDHGMSDTDCKRVIDIQNYINVNETFNTVGPFGRIRPKGKPNATLVREMISKLACKNDHMRVYQKEQLPVRYHYGNTIRLEPIFLDIDSGWTVISKTDKSQGICEGGAHGYDNLFPDMRAIFLAHGPSFKKNFIMRPFINTEIYEMLTELIDITPNPNNGTRGSFHYILTSPRTLPSQKEPESPAIGHVPSEESVYNDRLSISGCSCQESKKQVDMSDVAAVRDRHLPFGIPYSTKDNSSLYVLYNENYVSAFNGKYKFPLWSSFTLKSQGNYNLVKDICWKGDVRIPEKNILKCDDYTAAVEKNPYILQRPLFPPGFSDPLSGEETTFITNSVPKSLNHSNIIEEKFNEILNKWTSSSGELNVVMGPAFDVFATGIRPNSDEFKKMQSKHGPLLIPTHIFAVTTWCSATSNSLKTCDHSKLMSNAFLLPNSPFPMNCETPEKVITKNVARTVDVEKLAGVSFYTGIPIYEAIRLRTMMPERPL